MKSRSKHGILNIVLYIEKSLLYIIDNFPLISQSDILRIKMFMINFKAPSNFILDNRLKMDFSNKEMKIRNWRICSKLICMKV